MILFVFANFIFITSAFADNDSSTPASNAPNVKQQVSGCETTLKQMGESIHRLKRAATDLYAECRQQVEMAGEIDFIGGEVIPIMPVTAEGFGPEQYLPPRKKYIDLHMSQLSQLIPILNDEINSLVIPDENKNDSQSFADSMQNCLKIVKDNFASLQGLTVQPPYSNADIAGLANNIHDQVSKIDNDRKKIYHLVRGDKEQ